MALSSVGSGSNNTVNKPRAEDTRPRSIREASTPTRGETKSTPPAALVARNTDSFQAVPQRKTLSTASRQDTFSAASTQTASVRAPVSADTSAARGQAAVDFMKQYEGQRTIDTPLNGFHRTDPDNNCANAVCAALRQAGLFNGSPADANVGQLSRDLQAAGWTPVSPQDARPGDVIIINGSQHTELVESNVNGQLQSIGSNNVVSGGAVQDTQNLSVEKNPWFMRNGNQVLILRAPPSSGEVPGTPSPGTPGTGGSGGTPAGAPTAQLAYDGGTTYQPQVAQLQQALVKAGYMQPSELSGGEGYYGDRTRAAVAQLQADYGIQGDAGNNYGPRTQQALEAALARS